MTQLQPRLDGSEAFTKPHLSPIARVLVLFSILCLTTIGCQSNRGLVREVRDLQQRLQELEQAHMPVGHRKLTKEINLEALARTLGDSSEARIANDVLDPFENLMILGYRDDVYFTLNRSNGTDFAVEDITLEIPDGTTRVLVFMRGWLLGFGETMSNEVSIRRIVDHHLALEYANVRVKEVGLRTATITAVMILRDVNGDDPWTGWINAVVVYLGEHP